MTTKKQMRAYLKHQLATNPKWAQRGLLVIYSRQTDAEKVAQQTKEDNNVGFSGVDAEFLSSLADQLRIRGFLSPKQMQHLHRKIAKYHRQLLEVVLGSNDETVARFRADAYAWAQAQVPPPTLPFNTPVAMIAADAVMVNAEQQAHDEVVEENRAIAEAETAAEYRMEAEANR